MRRHLLMLALDLQGSVAVSWRLGEVEVCDRAKSALQISGLIAESEALYALETMQVENEKPKYAPSVTHFAVV